MKILHTNNAGVTFIETMLAVAILSISLTGSFSLIVQTTSLVQGTHNQLIAAHLAQEGMEIVHNVRMNNWIANAAWDAGLADGNYCADYTSAVLASCASYALFADASGRYSHSVATATPFSRRLNIFHETDSEGTHLRVQSIVSWNSIVFTAEEHLYDWR